MVVIHVLAVHRVFVVITVVNPDGADVIVDVTSGSFVFEIVFVRLEVENVGVASMGPGTVDWGAAVGDMFVDTGCCGDDGIPTAFDRLGDVEIGNGSIIPAVGVGLNDTEFSEASGVSNEGNRSEGVEIGSGIPAVGSILGVVEIGSGSGVPAVGNILGVVELVCGYGAQAVGDIFENVALGATKDLPEAGLGTNTILFGLTERI